MEEKWGFGWGVGAALFGCRAAAANAGRDRMQNSHEIFL